MSYRDRDEFESKMMEYDYYNNYYEHDYPDYYANDEYDDWEQKDNNNYGGYNNYYEYDQYDFDDYYGNNIGNNYNQYGEEDEEYVDEYDDYDDYEDDFEEFESSDEYEYDDYEESDDYKYDYYYGDCYRMYAAFQCTNRNTGCKETWLSDSVWEYYNRYNYPVECSNLCFVFLLDCFACVFSIKNDTMYDIILIYIILTIQIHRDTFPNSVQIQNVAETVIQEKDQC